MSEEPEFTPRNFRPFAQTADAISERGTPDPGNLIPGWLPADTERLLITGPSKAGKSWLAHEMVYSLATGEAFLGIYDLEYHEMQHLGMGVHQRVTRKGVADPWKTVYVQLENSLISMERRHAAIRVSHGGEALEDEQRIEGAASGDWLKVLHTDERSGERLRSLNLFDAEESAGLIQYLQEESAQILVLDSAWRTLPSTLNDETTAKYYTGVLEHIIDASGLKLLVLIHHSSTKGEGGGRKHRESMGSTFFTSAWHDLNWRVQRGKDGITTVAFDARDHMLDPQEVRMTEEGVWQEIDELSPAGLANIASQQDWGPIVKRGPGWGFKNATHAEVAQFIGSSSATVSRLIDVIRGWEGNKGGQDED